jgi:peptidoglycan hydrolase-like protein with peptidoglycan-binding domain
MAVGSDEVTLERGDRGRAVAQLQRRLGLRADGVFGAVTERAVKRFERSRGLVADGVVDSRTRRLLGLAPFQSRNLSGGTTTTGGSARLPAALVRIARCESGGNPRAVSRDGRYRGKYQFSLSTWRRLGGEGDPARAPESLQDQIALRLYRRAGTAPWGACG